MPAWEDVANMNGGKWQTVLTNDKSKYEEFDQTYLYTVLIMSFIFC